MPRNKKPNQKGFTLIELLTVISIIALISSSVFTSISQIRLKSQNAVALEQARAVAKAVISMAYDTGKSPTGCNFSTNGSDITSNLNALITKPSVGQSFGWPLCTWTASAVASWSGPYIDKLPKDPWGWGYTYAYNFHICGNNCGGPDYRIVSPGPDQSLSGYQDNVNVILRKYNNTGF